MSRTRVAWIGVTFLVLLGVGVWATTRPAGEFTGLDARLATSAGEAGHGGGIDLGDATDFEWDEVHIFGAYTTTAGIEAQMDGWSPLSPAGRFLIGDLFLAYDGLQLLAFRRDGEVVAWTVMNEEEPSQTYIEFDPTILPRVATPSDGTFIVRSFGGGWSLVAPDRANGDP